MRLSHKYLIGGAIVIATIATNAAAATGDPIRVSLDNGGGQATQPSKLSALSGDGSKVVFVSSAHLTGEPDGGHEQLYVRDTKTGSTVLVSASTIGVAANADVLAGTASNTYFDISANGRYVVFGSTASNLVAGDSNGKQDVFRKDLQTGETWLVSTGEDCSKTPCAPVESNGDSYDPSINADGARVAYATDASNLLRDDFNGATDVVVAEVHHATYVRPDRPVGSLRPNGPLSSPSISAYGDEVAFVAGAAATNLRPGDTNNASDVYIANSEQKTVAYAAEGTAPDLSGSGKLVAFLSASALSADDTNGLPDAYKYNVDTGSLQLLSTRDGLKAAGNGATVRVAIGADGVRAVFDSEASDIVSGDSNSASDVFSRRIDGAAVSRLGAGTGGAIAGNGGIVALTTPDAIVPEDTNAVSDVYTQDLGATDTTAPSPTSALYVCGYKGSGVTFISWNADPSGIGGPRALSDGFPGRALTVAAIDGAGNRSETTRVVAWMPGDSCETAPVDPEATPIREIRILSVKSAGGKLRVRYRTTGGQARTLANFRIQQVRLGRKGKTLGYKFVTRGRKVMISSGTHTITLSRPRGKGTYRLRALIGKGSDRTLTVKRFRTR